MVYIINYLSCYNYFNIIPFIEEMFCTICALFVLYRYNFPEGALKFLNELQNQYFKTKALISRMVSSVQCVNVRTLPSRQSCGRTKRLFYIVYT